MFSVKGRKIQSIIVLCFVIKDTRRANKIFLASIYWHVCVLFRQGLSFSNEYDEV